MSGSTCASLAQQAAHGVFVEHVVFIDRLCDAALPCACWSGHAGCSLFCVWWVCLTQTLLVMLVPCSTDCPKADPRRPVQLGPDG